MNETPIPTILSSPSSGDRPPNELSGVAGGDTVRLGLPSASDTAFWNCPGQWQLKQTIPPEELAKLQNLDDEFIAAGNRIDKARETGVLLELDQEETELYQSGVHFEELLLDRWMADNGLVEAEEGQRKERLWLNHPDTMQPICSGESDVHYISTPTPKHVLIVDWKLVGPNVTRAERNTQLRVLAVLKNNDLDGVEKIRVAINRCMAQVGGRDYCDYSADDLKHSQDWVLWHLWMSRQPDAPVVPGRWCLHCPCKTFCKQAGSYAMLPSVIAGSPASLAGLKGAELEARIEQLVGALVPVDLVKIWEMSTIVGKILKAVNERLKNMPTSELEALGLYIADGKRLDPITDTKGCFAKLRDKELWSEPDIFKCLSFSKTDLADVRQLEKGCGKKEAQEWIGTALAAFIEKKTSEGSLRQGVNPKKLQAQELGMTP